MCDVFETYRTLLKSNSVISLLLYVWDENPYSVLWLRCIYWMNAFFALLFTLTYSLALFKITNNPKTKKKKKNKQKGSKDHHHAKKGSIGSILVIIESYHLCNEVIRCHLKRCCIPKYLLRIYFCFKCINIDTVCDVMMPKYSTFSFNLKKETKNVWKKKSKNAILFKMFSCIEHTEY